MFSKLSETPKVGKKSKKIIKKRVKSEEITSEQGNFIVIYHHLIVQKVMKMIFLKSFPKVFMDE